MTLLSVPLWFDLGDKMTGLRFVVLLMALVLQSLQHRDFPLCTAAHSLCHVHHLHTLWHLEGRREEGSMEDSRGQANRGKKRKEEERGQRHSGRGTRWTRLVSSIASYIMWMHPSIVLSIQTDTHTHSHTVHLKETQSLTHHWIRGLTIVHLHARSTQCNRPPSGTAPTRTTTVFTIAIDISCYPSYCACSVWNTRSVCMEGSIHASSLISHHFLPGIRPVFQAAFSVSFARAVWLSSFCILTKVWRLG